MDLYLKPILQECCVDQVDQLLTDNYWWRLMCSTAAGAIPASLYVLTAWLIDTICIIDKWNMLYIVILIIARCLNTDTFIVFILIFKDFEVADGIKKRYHIFCNVSYFDELLQEIGSIRCTGIIEIAWKRGLIRHHIEKIRQLSNYLVCKDDWFYQIACYLQFSSYRMTFCEPMSAWLRSH
jgi:hypothetical protein